ncbi:MAG TPA: 23S rRNA (guanosine(2251)-2'-O)-methyltransferase RlmB [Stellaceae bacterium]|nr:23S rRNA (guanosine(2251)-2'-O)-methyltransferase RlmB [Stellaceae bacterium]
MRQSEPPRRLETPGEARPPRTARPGKGRGDGWLYGYHAVAAALANPRRRWRRLAILTGQEEAAEKLALEARAEHNGAQNMVQVLDRAAFNLLLPDGAVHQGWAVEVEPLEPLDLDEVLNTTETRGGRAIIVVLDQVTDPHNVGAVMRSAAAFGAVAVVVAEHGAPAITGVLAKAASGALDSVPLVRIVNLTRGLERLKAAGYWCCGLDETAPAPLATLDLGPRVALVLGSEGSGLRRLLREECDYLARLPTLPELPSLNISNAAAIALYELVRDQNSTPLSVSRP